MKLSKDPVFIGAALCLFFPLGLFLLLRHDCKKIYKIIFSAAGFMLFALILCLSFFWPTKEGAPKDYTLTVTRDALKVGESASLSVLAEETFYSDIEITAENDCLSVTGNVFTAEKVGSCLLTVEYGNEQETVEIHITADEGASEIVYCSAGGAKYHKSLTHGGKHAVEMTKEEAMQSGKEPCKVCY